MRQSIRRLPTLTFALLIFAGVLSFGVGPVVAGELKLAHFFRRPGLSVSFKLVLGHRISRSNCENLAGSLVLPTV